MDTIKSTTVAEMRAHVEAVLAPMVGRPDDALIVHTVKICRQARACIEVNEIWITEITSEISYATVLHEIGHLRGRHGWSRRVLTRERDAWRWAKAHALVWTAAMERDCRSNLAWYESQIKCGALSCWVPRSVFSEG